MDEQREVETILFYITDKEDGLKAIKALTDDIKSNDDANHKLYFRFLMADTYQVSMGMKDEEGKPHLIGIHEILFMPETRLGRLDTSFNHNKKIIFQKNCMFIVGEGDKAKATRQLLIDWLLEKKKEIKL